jgi:hypothetical protein
MFCGANPPKIPFPAIRSGSARPSFAGGLS